MFSWFPIYKKSDFCQVILSFLLNLGIVRDTFEVPLLPTPYTKEVFMKRVTGLGGVFFRCED
ncbi:MAG TPA: hypothetical protein PLL93_03825, partial [bacterium]|nr:hypothetical protein [bacterium]